MAVAKIVFQGLVEYSDHLTAVNELLSRPEFNRFLISVAFVRESGVHLIGANLAAVAGNADVYIGIRNGITSVQSLFAFLKIGINPFLVDTAAANRIFHPKIYAAFSERAASLLVGSANLTAGGLNENIEASVAVTLDRSVREDEAACQSLVRAFAEAQVNHPDHIFRLSGPRAAVELLRQGRLEDERLVRVSSRSSASSFSSRDDLSPIRIYRRTLASKAAGRPKKRRTRVQPISSLAGTAIEVWISAPLTKRSLNIPTGSNTNITGDTNLGLGAMQGIDFQTYFRDEVFDGLTWRNDPGSQNPELERAIFNAEIQVKGTSYGVFQLEITHDPRTDTASYAQRNAMTKIKWGDARELIAKPDLLGRTLRLLKIDPTSFVITIE